MSKVHDAQEAAREVREQAFKTGMPVIELIEKFAFEYGVKSHVVESWVLRDPQVESLEAFDLAIANYHQAVADNEARQLERSRQREQKFSELAKIIDSIPQKNLLFSLLNTVGFAPAQSWRDWIKKNCLEPESDRDDAFAFARTRMETRLNDGKQADA